jgi:hypothetical protein
MPPFQTTYHVCVFVCLDIVSRSNLFLKDVFVDEISITLRGRDSERLKFIAKVDKLPPGQSTITLSCPVRLTISTVSRELNCIS